MTKPLLRYAEFYITNVCNLTCPQCNRFNNRQFRGHLQFDLSMYQPWAEKIDLAKCSILGGEPTLNPALESWVRGVHQCWPNAEGHLVSNGTYLDRTPNLEKMLIDTSWQLDICVHNPGMRQYVLDQIDRVFGYCELLRYQDTTFYLRSHQGVRINLTHWQYFHNNVFQDPSTLQLHDSDANAAHDVCHMKACHHFINGRLYKCGVVYLLPQYFQQIGQAVPDLYSEYQPLTIHSADQFSIDSLSQQAIPQCKFCPSQLKFERNEARFKSRVLNIKVLSQ